MPANAQDHRNEASYETPNPDCLEFDGCAGDNPGAPDPETSGHDRSLSEFGMEPQGEKRHRAASEIIAGVVDKLIIRADMQAVGDRVFVIGFKNALA